jgi:flagellar hook-associated protein 1 FlgK
MASDLLSIGASGARAARGALDVTAQNIANASSDG